MTQISEVMSRNVHVVEPQEKLQRAAQLMQGLNVGSLPVSDGQRLLGIVTDRDITVRGVAGGMAPDAACVSDVMTAGVSCCRPDQDAQEVMQMMGEQQIRRLPVVDADERLVGIVSLGDLAVRQSGHIDKTVRDISSPSAAPHRGNSPAEHAPQMGVAME
jgi:CBS domain-containing protein